MKFTPFVSKREWIIWALKVSADKDPKHAERRAIYTFVIPLEWCLTTNELQRKHWSIQAKIKDNILDMVKIQLGKLKCDKPLDGRPIVELVRFSKTQPDQFSDWPKLPIDALRVSKRWQTRASKSGYAEIKGVGMIHDDSPKCIDARKEWFSLRLPKEESFVIMRIYEDPLQTPKASPEVLSGTSTLPMEQSAK